MIGSLTLRWGSLPFWGGSAGMGPRSAWTPHSNVDSGTQVLSQALAGQPERDAQIMCKPVERPAAGQLCYSVVGGFQFRCKPALCLRRTSGETQRKEETPIL